jgi:hypothetical protein
LGFTNRGGLLDWGSAGGGFTAGDGDN